MEKTSFFDGSLYAAAVSVTVIIAVSSIVLDGDSEAIVNSVYGSLVLYIRSNGGSKKRLRLYKCFEIKMFYTHE